MADSLCQFSRLLFRDRLLLGQPRFQFAHLLAVDLRQVLDTGLVLCQRPGFLLQLVAQGAEFAFQGVAALGKIAGGIGLGLLMERVKVFQFGAQPSALGCDIGHGGLAAF